MIPVQFCIHLAFKSRMVLYSYSDKLLQRFSLSEHGSVSIPESGTRLKFDKEKTSIWWTPDFVRVTSENLSNMENATKDLTKLTAMINDIIPIGSIKSRRFSIHWILPAPKADFEYLEKIYRDMMIINNSVTNNAVDSSVIIDNKIDNYCLHHQSGAMAPAQLNSVYLRYNRKDLPKAFIFLETSLLDGSVIEYSLEELKEFIDKSCRYCSSHSDLFGKIWEDVL